MTTHYYALWQHVVYSCVRCFWCMEVCERSPRTSMHQKRQQQQQHNNNNNNNNNIDINKNIIHFSYLLFCSLSFPLGSVCWCASRIILVPSDLDFQKIFKRPRPTRSVRLYYKGKFECFNVCTKIQFQPHRTSEAVSNTMGICSNGVCL